MEFGTPEQDALRRDFTINSMFYNLNSGMVEDFTGKGLDDLRAGIIRTPLPPSHTFLDDPLRVLRAVRFGTRFGFELETSILEAAASDQVREALGSKVSRERIGVELEGMFAGRSPGAAVQLLQRLQIFPQVFTPPAAVASRLPANWPEACSTTAAVAEDLLREMGMELSVESKRLFFIATLLLPLRSLQYPAGKGSKQAAASSYIIKDSIKWRVKEAEGVELLHAAAAELLHVHQQLGAAQGAADLSSVPENLRVQLGRNIRKLKELWQLGVLLAPLLQLPSAVPLGIELGSGDVGAGGSSSSSTGGAQEGPELQQHVAIARELMAAAAGLGLEDAWKWKPLLDGKQVMKILGLQKTGPQLGQLLNGVLDWQFSHPQGSLEECETFIKQQWQDRTGTRL